MGCLVNAFVLPIWFYAEFMGIISEQSNRFAASTCRRYGKILIMPTQKFDVLFHDDLTITIRSYCNILSFIPQYFPEIPSMRMYLVFFAYLSGSDKVFQYAQRPCFARIRSATQSDNCFFYS